MPIIHQSPPPPLTAVIVSQSHSTSWLPQTKVLTDLIVDFFTQLLLHVYFISQVNIKNDFMIHKIHPHY